MAFVESGSLRIVAPAVKVAARSPLLLAVISQLNGTPTVPALAVLSVLLTVNSARAIVTVSVEELLSGFPSFTLATVAVLETLAAMVLAIFTRTVIGSKLAPAARLRLELPVARVHVNEEAPAAPLQLQLVPVGVAYKVIPVGSVSVTVVFTLPILEVPTFETTIENEPPLFPTIKLPL
ncbi:hypothetical protein SDC9_89174 [bioreactor metagenome]|uniref:Uncharacterized protein n=1 Tax=bioreactor metagenome TaxID=1076179 RepID=A0A644ZNH8_9ZZZZ